MYFNDDISNKLGFDNVATHYDLARPSYPQALFDEFFAHTKDSTVIEVGSGTGQATISLIQRSSEVHCIEPGNNLFGFLSDKFSGEPSVKLFKGFFEEFQTDEKFDVIFSASAIHWVPKETAYQRFKELLNPDGRVLFVWHQPILENCVYELIEQVVKPKISDFRIPNWSDGEQSAFHRGYDDFCSRGFADCQLKVYEEVVTLLPDKLVDLVWSYMSYVETEKYERDAMLDAFKSGIKNLGRDAFTVNNVYPSVSGKIKL